MSDHFSGPRAIAGPACDICDFYAFSSPERVGNLVLVLDVVPNADPATFFSDAIVYRFRIRPVTVAGKDTGFAPGEEEVTFDCTFGHVHSHGGDTVVQEGTCSTASGERISFVVDDAHGARGNGVRVFAGHRSDPFFIDFAGLNETMKLGRLVFTNPGTLTGPGANVLSIVVEIDCATALPSGIGPLFAAVGETVARGPLAIRLERVGRPEVKNLLLNPRAHDLVNRTVELRDLYNLEDSFHVGPDYRDAYHARVSSNLIYFDTLDGKTDWPLDAQGLHPLTNLILADYLVVDISKPYAEDSFLEIERSMLDGRLHTSSGGRSLNDDAMDALYTLYVNAGRGPRISDHLDQATVRASRAFPYLAPPNAQREIPKSAAGAAAAKQDNKNSYVVHTDGGGHVHLPFGRNHS